MFVLNDPEQLRSIVGGTDPIVNITGGYIVNGSNGATFTNYNGDSLFLPGVKVTSSDQWDDAHYQLNGTIHLDPEGGADVGTLIHEYGHYLQQQILGDAGYYNQVAIPSVYSAATNSYDVHNAQAYEVTATYLGNNFVKNSNPGFYYNVVYK